MAHGCWSRQTRRADARVVVGQGVVTSRKPDDIPAFNSRMLQEFAKDARSSGKKKLA